jgi:hypothetical protein
MQILVVDEHELAAGKLAALVTQSALRQAVDPVGDDLDLGLGQARVHRSSDYAPTRHSSTSEARSGYLGLTNHRGDRNTASATSTAWPSGPSHADTATRATSPTAAARTTTGSCRPATSDALPATGPAHGTIGARADLVDDVAVLWIANSDHLLVILDERMRKTRRHVRRGALRRRERWRADQ